MPGTERADLQIEGLSIPEGWLVTLRTYASNDDALLEVRSSDDLKLFRKVFPAAECSHDRLRKYIGDVISVMAAHI